MIELNSRFFNCPQSMITTFYDVWPDSSSEPTDSITFSVCHPFITFPTTTYWPYSGKPPSLSAM